MVTTANDSDEIPTLDEPSINYHRARSCPKALVLVLSTGDFARSESTRIRRDPMNEARWGGPEKNYCCI